MSKLIIVHVIPSLRKGGAERLTVDICNHLSENERLNVHLISLYENDDSQSFINELSDKVNYIELGKAPGFDPVVFTKLYKRLKAIGPHVVHTHINAFEYVTAYRLFHKSVRFFHTIHSKAEKECPNPVVKWQRKYFYKKNTQAITISIDGSQTYKAYYGLSNDVIIENGRAAVEPSDDFFTVRKIQEVYKGKYLIVHLGRIIKVKNQQLLIQAVKLFNQTQGQKVHLLILGGVREQELMDELKALAGTDNPDITFKGDVSNVGDYLLAADAFCLSSSHEGMPMSVIEALSVGCPPVSTPVGGIPDMIQDGVSGFLSKDMSVGEYKNAIERCLYFEEKDVLKENCKREFKKKYDISICSNKYLELYRS